MSALQHLRDTGRLNDEGAELLYNTVARVARSRSFPPPEPHGAWSDEAIQEASHDFLAGPKAASRLLNLALLSSDEDHFARRLYTAVLNNFRDRARQTTVGKIMRKVREVAEQNDQLRLSPGPPEAIETPTSSAGIVYGGSDDILIRAAASTHTEIVRWRPEAERGVPIANRDDLVAVLLNIVKAADAPVALTQISHVVARRFNLTSVPSFTQTDTLDPRAVDPAEEVEVDDQARSILRQLTHRERQVLPLMDLSVRDAGAALNLSRSTIAREQARIRDILARTLPAGRDGETILRLLVERAGNVGGEHERGGNYD